MLLWVYLTVFGLFLLVRRLTDNETLALLSAGFLSIYPAHVIQSHYMVVDVPAVMWTVFALYVFLIALDSTCGLVGQLPPVLFSDWVFRPSTLLSLIALPMIIMAVMKSLTIISRLQSEKDTRPGQKPIIILL